MTVTAEQLATLTCSGPTLEDWAERLALAGYSFARDGDVLRAACPLCGPVYLGEWVANGTIAGDSVLIVAPGATGEIEALCGRCGTEAGAVWDQLEPLQAAGVSTVRPSGGVTVDTPGENRRGNGDLRVSAGGVSDTPLTPPPDTRPKLRVLDVERMLTTDPPPVPWTVEPLLATGCVTLLAGREGQGKSMLALALAAAVGHGAHVAGFDCHAGTVLYVDAENGEREAHRRVRGLGVKPGTLVYAEAQGFNLRHDMGLLAALMAEHEPSVVVLDSLRSLAPGLDENDSAQAEATLRPVAHIAQNTGTPVLLLAHAGKAGHEYRGSTAIGAAVELGFTLARHPDDPHGRTRRRLTCWKSRPAPEPEQRWIELEPRDGLILLGEAAPFDPKAGRREEVADLLLAALDQPLSWPFWARAAGLDKNDSTARRAREKLRDEGLVEKNAQGHWTAREGA